MGHARRLVALTIALVFFSLSVFVLIPAYAKKAATVAEIGNFYIESTTHMVPGSELIFTVEGTPRGSVAVRIDGANRTVMLVEVERGVYVGSYTVTTRDKIDGSANARATLRFGRSAANESMPLGEASNDPLASFGP